MGIHNRPANCTSCNKRLSLKSVYYRNGKWFCNRRCWDAEQVKLAEEAEKAAKEKAKEEAAKTEELASQEVSKEEKKEEKPKTQPEASKNQGKEQQGAKT